MTLSSPDTISQADQQMQKEWDERVLSDPKLREFNLARQKGKTMRTLCRMVIRSETSDSHILRGGQIASKYLDFLQATEKLKDHILHETVEIYRTALTPKYTRKKEISWGELEQGICTDHYSRPPQDRAVLILPGQELSIFNSLTQPVQRELLIETLLAENEHRGDSQKPASIEQLESDLKVGDTLVSSEFALTIGLWCARNGLLKQSTIITKAGGKARERKVLEPDMEKIQDFITNPKG